MKLRIAIALLVLFPVAAEAGVKEISLKLPVHPRLVIGADQKLAVAPFVLVTEDQSRNRAARVDVQSEFSRYLRKEINKSTKVQAIDVGTTRLPGSTMQELEADRDYWRELAASTGADFILSGVIDFDVEDKAGYRTEEYVSPLDGRTYYRQVLIESTGFVFDIVVAVFDGDTGEKLIEENFRDFKEFDQRNYDEILGLFENLRSLEKQLLGIFASQETTATRFLFNR
ncbi:MAG TPA: hypothetical protein VMS12_12205 [Thermoanaerobaculia bacterium]|nr:hypothetical protein [Thermoanaerobaculia bacterium]